MYKLSKYTAITDLDQEYKLIYSTRTSEFIRITYKTYDLIEKSRFDLISDKLLFKLFDAEILVQSKEDEFENHNRIISEII